MPADRAPSVLITGIHSDLGFAISHRFRREGWFVIGCDQGTATGRNARVHITADLTDEAECVRAARRAAKLGNGIDSVVNCAAVRFDGPVEETGSGAWDVMMDVNAKSVFLLAKAAMPYLETTQGTIVVIGPGGSADAEHTAFDASRGAVVALTAALTDELAPHGIRVRLIGSADGGPALTPDDVAEQVWAVTGFDPDGHELSFAHAH
jgi:NAD(P)-dependent dehydrogenase (short-subunit alcohol dehydrogenase family)